MAVLTAQVRAIALQACWDGLKEDLLVVVLLGSEKLGGTGETMSPEVRKLKQFAAWQAHARRAVSRDGKRASTQGELWGRC